MVKEKLVKKKSRIMVPRLHRCPLLQIQLIYEETEFWAHIKFAVWGCVWMCAHVESTFHGVLATPNHSYPCEMLFLTTAREKLTPILNGVMLGFALGSRNMPR
eukprot:Gregarina_sp_Pseudo_9__3085@NODE_3282_length_693_cov_1_876147_g2997_i0_p1_GENE_NODE_3282_length_693_cov_1_876147_g2997_i0NODE_3282_length_693_cov_1_876147_g2997_i0_p1_ORF_typecomplete_len103_score7_59TOM13/PF08219_11/3_6e03TOM13/PF08219_11/0_2_NODE_3282_length_693_cov_1_876147_g2997_i0162470